MKDLTLGVNLAQRVFLEIYLTGHLFPKINIKVINMKI